MADPNRFESVYLLLRMVAGTIPCRDEDVAMRRFRLAYATAFGSDAPSLDVAANHHRRYLREAEMLVNTAFAPRPAVLQGLVAGTSFRGLSAVQQLRGSIVLAAHVESWIVLPALLSRWAHCGMLERLVIATMDPELFTPEWYAQMDSHGLGCADCVSAADTIASDGAVLDSLARSLKAGATVLMYADGTILPLSAKGVPVMIGNLRVPLPLGAATLSRLSRCPVRVASVCDHRDEPASFDISFSETAVVTRQGDNEILAGRLQTAFDASLATDPVRWLRWASIGERLEQRADIRLSPS